MRRIKSLAICLVVVTAVFAKSETATFGLMERIIPGYSKQFIIENIPKQNGDDVFEIESKGNKIVLRGSTGVAQATAFHYYLKYTCNAHVSWTGDQLKLPKLLPMPRENIRQVINGKYRVYMNYCTFSYSAPWWDWKRWEREIDLMAMNGINMPLMVTGLEAVWYNTLLKFKFTDLEARTFLAGPAHIAWQWMQNLQSYGGPLPKSWIDSHLKLGKKILAREQEFGMTPIMQGFSGYVPREIMPKYPNAKIVLQRGWGGFNKGPAQIDPNDPFFLEFGKMFLMERERLFGPCVFYAADPFHESKPPVNTPEYLSSVGKTIHNLFKMMNKDAVWVMQGWDIYKEIVQAVPKSDLIILDLSGGLHKKHENFWGYPFVYGTLHNFGGRINMHGDLKYSADNQYEIIKKYADNVSGQGFFMEGIEQNQVFYDLAFEMLWRSGKIDVVKWLNDYANRRYGYYSINAHKAWSLLYNGPYKPGTNGVENSSIIAARPELDVNKSGPNQGFSIPYSESQLYNAMSLLLLDKELLKASKPYRFDLVDLQRQIMSNLGQTIYKAAMIEYKDKNYDKFKFHTNQFLELLSDLDVLLRSTSIYNFDKWINDARSWGRNKYEKNLFEKDATSLVTYWGYADSKEPRIFDYSWREWSGLIDGYYKVRWKMFFDMLAHNLQNRIEYDDSKLPKSYERAGFRSNGFYVKMADFEENYSLVYEKVRNPIVQGDEIQLVNVYFAKYKKLFELYKENNLPNRLMDNKVINTNENLGN